jgi:hypothetical protein
VTTAWANPVPEGRDSNEALVDIVLCRPGARHGPPCRTAGRTVIDESLKRK